MTNQEAIETIKANYPDERYTMLREALNMAIKAMEKQNVPDTNVGKWISVDDRMPENELMVIGYTPVDGYMFIGFHRTHVSTYYEWSDWYIITSMRSTKKITKKVTHWMPLPEPPKEEI